MAQSFAEILSSIRRDKGVSQRRAAADLKISQALLSHYENGAREPGLMFVCRACDYYGVTADYLLGRTGYADAHMTGETFSSVAALQSAIRDRNDDQVEAQVAKFVSAAARKLCAEIYGIADARTLIRLSLEMAEAENAIVRAFPGESTENKGGEG